MSLIHTESFIAFDPTVGDDTYTPDNSTMRNAVAAALRRAGYEVVIQAQTSAGASGGFAMRTDPVAPDRVNLVHSNGATASAGGTVTAAIRKIFGSQAEAIIGGFSMYIPAEFVKAPAVTTTPVVRIMATNIADASWSVLPSAGVNALAKEVFRISPDLLVRWQTDAAMSSKSLIPGRVNFVEYRIADGEVRVWIDDVLVLQKAVALNSESIAFVFENTNVTGGTNMLGAPGRWAIGNWYNLVEDARAPNVRLGPTTRVIGVRPDTDIDVDFTPATPVPKNATVASQAIVDNPPNSLQSTTVGDLDVYATTKDTSTAGGAMVHAVAVKVLAANLESNPHALRPIVRSATGVEGVDVRPRMWRAIPIIGAGRELRGVARRPTDQRTFIVGQAHSVYSTPSNLGATPGSDPVFTQHADDGVIANWYNAIAFRADGTGVIVRNDGKLAVLAPGSNDPVLVAVTNTTQLNSVAVLPDGRFIAVGASGVVMRSATPEVAASWVRTVNAAGLMNQVAVNTNNGRIVASSTNSGGVVYSSEDGGNTWISRTVGGSGSNFPAVTWDGTYFMAAYLQNGGYNRRSVDGALWTPMFAQNNTNGSGQMSVAFMAADPAQGIALMGGTAVVTSENSFDWRVTTNIPNGTTQVNHRAAATMANGDWLVVGYNGFAIVYSNQAPDNALTPLAGYQATFNSSAVNPATGAPWTPLEASQAQFGMRLTS